MLYTFIFQIVPNLGIHINAIKSEEKKKKKKKKSESLEESILNANKHSVTYKSQFWSIKGTCRNKACTYYVRFERRGEVFCVTATARLSPPGEGAA